MKNIVTDLKNIVNKRKNDTAISYIDSGENIVNISYTQFLLDICKASNCLKNKGDRIGILAKNSYNYLVWYFAIFVRNAVVVLLNVESSLTELEHEIKLSQVDCIIDDGEYEKYEPLFAEKYTSKLIDINEYKKYSPDNSEKTNAIDDSLALILFTSGTTGLSKGVMLSHKNIKTMIDCGLDYLDQYVISSNEDIMYAAFPFYHIGGVGDFMTWIYSGHALGIGLDKRYFFRDIVKLNCTYTSVVPAVLETIYKFFKRGNTECIGKIKKILVSAAKCEASMFKFFRENGISLYQLYGLSENSGFGLYNFTGRKDDSIGIEQKFVKCRIIDGEICLSGDMVMIGYCQDEKATSEIIIDGWLHTGDLGRKDEEGYVYITGRKKNLIILSSGENISPEELESKLYENQDIIECLVKEKDNKVCAVIYCDTRNIDNVRDYIADMNKKLPYFKHISLIEFIDKPFERTGSGKIKRG